MQIGSDMKNLILRVSQSGLPVQWVHWQDAVSILVKEQVLWSMGETAMRIEGGTSRLTGKRSYIDLPTIIAVKGILGRNLYDQVPPLNNTELFRRDQHTCAYCLQEMKDRHLSRDHVVPISRGGQNVWTNVVTACRVCNQKKDNMLLHETKMKLHMVPFTPNYAEWLILRNRNILLDQMQFLKARCPKERRHLM